MSVTQSAHLRVLVLDEEAPWPPNSGKRIRTWNLLRRLAVRHELHLVTYGAAGPEAQDELARHGIAVTAVDPLSPSRGTAFYLRLFGNLFSPYPYSVAKHFTRRLQREIASQCAGSQYDLVHIEWAPYARYATPGLPRVISAHNVESDIWKRRAAHSETWMGRDYFQLQAQRMQKFERMAAVQADCVVAVSELDARAFHSYGAGNVTVVPNGVDLDYFRPIESQQSNSLVFVGSLDWFPNEDAVTDFAARVLPVLRGTMPINFKIVGRRPSSKLVVALQGVPEVELVGEVADVRPYLAEARAIVVPLRIGGGTRIKILEALAMGRPVISTSVGAEGLELEDGRDLMIANTPQEFAHAIESLFAEPERQTRLGRNGRALVEKLYGWDAAAEKLERAWLAVAGQAETPVVLHAFAEGAKR